MFLYRLFVGLYRTMILIQPQNRSAFLKKYDQTSMTLNPCLCSLYQVWGMSSVRWSILDLTQAWECDIALERCYNSTYYSIFLQSKLTTTFPGAIIMWWRHYDNYISRVTRHLCSNYSYGYLFRITNAYFIMVVSN